jgi:hypothetical protein
MSTSFEQTNPVHSIIIFMAVARIAVVVPAGRLDILDAIAH